MPSAVSSGATGFSCKATGPSHAGQPLSCARVRRAFTLIELLVVISILSLLALLSIPIIGPTLRARETREAARSLSAMIQLAQNRAIELGRPVGLWIERGQTEPDSGVAVHLCEMPPAFTGFSESAMVRIEVRELGGEPRMVVTGFADVATVQGLVKPGDVMQLPGRNDRFVIDRVPGDPLDVAPFEQFLRIPNSVKPWVLTTEFSLFQSANMMSMQDVDPAADVRMGMQSKFVILRQPLRTTRRPLQFSPGGVIDLSTSGFDTDNGSSAFSVQTETDPDNTTIGALEKQQLKESPVMVMFRADGSLDRVFMKNQSPLKTTNAVYLMIGKQELCGASGDLLKLNAEPGDFFYGYQDPTARWLRIEAATGHVTVAETVPPAANLLNAVDRNPSTTDATKLSQFAGQVRASRELARGGVAIGGDH